VWALCSYPSLFLLPHTDANFLQPRNVHQALIERATS
jgi:hypothetical protein